MGNSTVTEPPYLRMRRRLDESVGDPIWPEDVHLDTFTDGHAVEAHALLELAYADGGGSVPSFPEWWGSLSHDSEYDPGLCFPVRDGNGGLVGFAQCWTTSFVKDFVVHPHHRRRGIGRALLLHTFRIFRERDAEAVDLKVQTDNPSGAVRFYESLGMIRISS
jgi:ribosomal protein S18 acetylase RimI-like enzyme